MPRAFPLSPTPPPRGGRGGARRWDPCHDVDRFLIQVHGQRPGAQPQRVGTQVDAAHPRGVQLDLVDALAGDCWPHAHGSNAYRPTT